MLDLDVIKESALFRNIDDIDVDTMCTELRPLTKMYLKGEAIQIQGDIVEKIGIILDGKVLFIKYHYDGTSQILQSFHNNDIIGLEAVSSTFVTSPGMLIADSDCVIVFFDYSRIFTTDRVSDSCKISLLKNMNKILSDENIKIMYKVDVLSKRTIRDRVITYLSIISEKRSSEVFDIGMTQEQFAQYLCTNRSALSKELNDMRREGLIDFSGTIYTVYNGT